MRGAMESHRPVDQLQRVVAEAQNLTGEATVSSAGQASSSTSGAVGKLGTMWDNSNKLETMWDNSNKLDTMWDNSNKLATMWDNSNDLDTRWDNSNDLESSH